MSMVINLIGGTGNTFSFVALCAFKAKSQQLKAFGKASIVPSFFRISEPAIFGAPIIFNPILMIPICAGRYEFRPCCIGVQSHWVLSLTSTSW